MLDKNYNEFTRISRPILFKNIFGQQNNRLSSSYTLLLIVKYWNTTSAIMLSGGKFQACVLYNADFVGYDDEDCAFNYCFACSLPSEVYFKLKGICGKSDTDSAITDIDYLLMFGYPGVNSLNFRGFTGLTSIYFDEDTQRWILSSLRLEFSHHNLFTWNHLVK